MVASGARATVPAAKGIREENEIRRRGSRNLLLNFSVACVCGSGVGGC